VWIIKKTNVASAQKIFILKYDKQYKSYSHFYFKSEKKLSLLHFFKSVKISQQKHMNQELKLNYKSYDRRHVADCV